MDQFNFNGTSVNSFEDKLNLSNGGKSFGNLTRTFPGMENINTEEISVVELSKSYKKLPTRSVSFVEMQDQTFERDEEIASEILRSNSFSNAHIQTYHSQCYNTIKAKSSDNSLFSSNVCRLKSQTLPFESNRSDSEYMATSFNTTTRRQDYLNSSLTSSITFGHSLSKPTSLKEHLEDNEIPEVPARKRAYSMNTLSTNHSRTLDPGELSDILYTSSNGKRLPRASVNDLRYILKIVSSSKSDHLNGRYGSSGSRTLSGQNSGSVHSSFVKEKGAEDRKIVNKTLLIVDQLLGEVSAALRNLNQAKQ